MVICEVFYILKVLHLILIRIDPFCDHLRVDTIFKHDFGLYCHFLYAFFIDTIVIKTSVFALLIVFKDRFVDLYAPIDRIILLILMGNLLFHDYSAPFSYQSWFNFLLALINLIHPLRRLFINSTTFDLLFNWCIWRLFRRLKLFYFLYLLFFFYLHSVHLDVFLNFFVNI